MLLLSAGMGSTFFFLSIFVQDALGFSPLRAGLAFLPMATAQFAAARLAPRLVARYQPKTVTLVGSAAMLAAGIWLTQLTHAHGYPATVLGPLILFGTGVGLAFMPLNLLILAGLPPRDTGSASGLLQCLQQLGVALGIAVLTTVYVTSLHSHHAVTHAVAAAFIVSASLIAAAVLVTLLVMGKTRPPAPEAPDEE
jgi:predicted MFS family arabinose efflux permease